MSPFFISKLSNKSKFVAEVKGKVILLLSLNFCLLSFVLASTLTFFITLAKYSYFVIYINQKKWM